MELKNTPYSRHPDDPAAPSMLLGVAVVPSVLGMRVVAEEQQQGIEVDDGTLVAPEESSSAEASLLVVVVVAPEPSW